MQYVTGGIIPSKMTHSDALFPITNGLARRTRCTKDNQKPHYCSISRHFVLGVAILCLVLPVEWSAFPVPKGSVILCLG